MSQNMFLKPAMVEPLFEAQIVPAYQNAFAGEPWNEVSKCVDPQRSCVGGLSSLAVGAACDTCGLYLARPAYEPSELISRFKATAVDRPTAWYVEKNDDEQVTLAAFAWRASPETIALEKYGDVPAMNTKLAELLPAQVAWVDEVFANRALKDKGNLRNFGRFISGLTLQVGANIAVFRTISPQMVRAAERDFAQAATILRAKRGVPDRRDLVIIDLGKVIQTR